MKLMFILFCLLITICSYSQRLNSVNVSKSKGNVETIRALQSSNNRALVAIRNVVDSIKRTDSAFKINLPETHQTDSLDALQKKIDAGFEVANLAIENATTGPEDQSDPVDHIIEIQGLGNIANSQNGNSLSPSASINAKILFLPKNESAKLYLGYNLGAELDSTKLDSIKLGNLFLPDRSKAGYSARLEYNILSLFKINANQSENGYTYNTEINPFVEYNYNKVNIKGVNEDSSKIQTSTWLMGINFSRIIYTRDNNNVIAIQVTPYYKTVKVTAGTYNTYNAIFKQTLKGIESPHKLSFTGITVGLQINKFLFSFDYQNLHSKTLQNTPINGGVFTLRATVIGDLIKL